MTVLFNVPFLPFLVSQLATTRFRVKVHFNSKFF
jgi:hypothetical protein